MQRTYRFIMLTAALLVLPAAAHAAHAGPFDVEQASRAYLDLLQGPARAKSDAYFEGGYWLTLWNALVGILIAWLMLQSGFAARLRSAVERRVKRRWLTPAVYAFPYVLATTLIALPWTIYTDYWRERHYGLLNQGFGAWLGDTGKMVIVGMILSALLYMALFGVIRRFPRRWWLLGAVTVSGFATFGALITPVFIAPLFNSYTEMPAGPLRDRIVAMAAANHIPARHIYVSDASRQSKRISANVSGLGPTIRITLNDNLLKRTGPDEVAAVMGHEMGHYVLGHVDRFLVYLFGLALVVLYAIYRIAPALIARHPQWGVRDVADPAAIPVLTMLATAAGLILTPVLASISRTAESQADRFGLNVAREPDGFAKVAMRLSEYRKIEPTPWEEALFYDHPSGATRVRMAMQWKKDHLPRAKMVKPSLAVNGR